MVFKDLSTLRSCALDESSLSIGRVNGDRLNPFNTCLAETASAVRRTIYHNKGSRMYADQLINVTASFCGMSDYLI